MKLLFIAAVLATDGWADLPAGARMAMSRSWSTAAPCAKGTPTVEANGQIFYAPGRPTYGSECPPGTWLRTAKPE